MYIINSVFEGIFRFFAYICKKFPFNLTKIMATHHLWTKPYHDVVEQQYRLDAAGQQEFEAFFVKLDQLAYSCPDQGAFSNQLLQGPLYQEYNALLMKYQKCVVAPNGQTTDQQVADMRSQAAADGAGEFVESMARREVNAAISHALPDEVNRIRWAGARALPVIGPIIQWLDNIRWFRSMFGNK